jgi:hypothetical protein
MNVNVCGVPQCDCTTTVSGYFSLGKIVPHTSHVI